MRPISSHQHLKEKALIIRDYQKAVLMTVLKQSEYSLPLAILLYCRKNITNERQLNSKCCMEICISIKLIKQ